MTTGSAVQPQEPPSNIARPDRFLVSLVVPCFNEQDVISLTYQRLVDVLGNSGFGLQIVFVDDGSTDATPWMTTEFSSGIRV